MRKTLAARLNLAAEADKPKEEVVKKERDDDTHYFDSYAYNGRSSAQRARYSSEFMLTLPPLPFADIHEIMLKGALP
jgi:hypothetical protein